MSRHVNKCRILYSLDWIARYSSEYWLSVISIVIQLCKKVVNKVITYSDHASFTIIISWSPNIMSILTATTPCYQDKLKNGAAPCISPKLQNCIFSFCLALSRSAPVCTLWVLLFLPMAHNCSITNLHNKKESVDHNQSLTKMILQRIAR